MEARLAERVRPAGGRQANTGDGNASLLADGLATVTLAGNGPSPTVIGEGKSGWTVSPGALKAGSGGSATMQESAKTTRVVTRLNMLAPRSRVKCLMDQAEEPSVSDATKEPLKSLYRQERGFVKAFLHDHYESGGSVLGNSFNGQRVWNSAQSGEWSEIRQDIEPLAIPGRTYCVKSKCPALFR